MESIFVHQLKWGIALCRSLHKCEHFVIRELLSSRKGTNCKRLKWTYPEETKRQLVFSFLAVKPNNWAGVERMGKIMELKISLITFKEKEISFHFSKIDYMS